jgi:glycosyltransferase involved in cell wall biosynthesis
MPSTNLVSIIIPLYQESDNVDYLVNELVQTFKKNELFNVEFILVDDGSNDDTFERIVAADFQGMTAKAIRLSKNCGSHEALKAGILRSGGNMITFLPADLQDPPALSIELYKKLLSGYDIVWGQRRTYKKKYSEKVFSNLYAYLMRKFALPSFPKKGFDVAMFNEKVRKQLNANIESNSSLLLQIMSMGFKQGFVEYDKTDRTRGTSKWTLSKKIKLLVDSFVAFSFAPIRIVSMVGILFFLTGIFWTVYITMRKIILNDIVSGWPMLTSILLLGFGITNISLGIIAEYLWRTLDASRKRPVFIIDEIIDLPKK